MQYCSLWFKNPITSAGGPSDEAAAGAAAPRALGPVRTKNRAFYPEGDSLKETHLPQPRLMPAIKVRTSLPKQAFFVAG